MKAYKVRFFNYEGSLAICIVLAHTWEEAKELLLKDYKDFDLEIRIEEYEVIEDKGVVLTWHQGS